MTQIEGTDRRLRRAGWLVAAALILAHGTAAAQLQLVPTAPSGEGSVSEAAPKSSSEPAKAKAPVKPILVKPPSEESVLGQPLTFEGAKGAMQFERSGAEIVVTKLTLPGERLSKPTEACSVDIVGQQPIVATPAGRPSGALRWNVAIEACPFTADVLDGAVLVTSGAPTCDFSAADCRVSPVGLWGPQGNAISAQRIKDLERERVRAETVMRTNFRVLLHRAGKDRAAVKTLAGEQAGFSSQREMTCRDYAKEAVHGFCSAQITQARSLAILARFPDAADATPRKSKGEARSASKRIATKKPAPKPTEPEPAAEAGTPQP